MADHIALASEHHRTVRKLAAIDIAFLGSRFILAEYTLGVFGCGALGLFAVYTAAAASSPSLPSLLVGIYLLTLAINYVPMLAYSVAIVRKGNARAEMAYEVAHKDIFMGKYRVYSLLLLLPFVIPALALWQERAPRP